MQIKNLSVDFITGGNKTHAVKKISLKINRGEIVALVGESGSGKSVSSLSILQLLPVPSANYAEGNIFFSEDGINETDLLQLKNEALQKIRGNKIAMIFQEPMSSLNPVMKCGEQVMEALLVHKNLAAFKAKEITIEWFEKLQLPEPQKLFNKYPHELSGGQKQRVMIAMAMCCQPLLLICDEPTTALDVTVQKEILKQIKELQLQQNMGVLFITHDLGIVAQIADRVAIMYKGEIVEENETVKIFEQPSHPYTKALIACRPSAHSKGKRLPVVADYLDATDKEQIDGTIFPEIKQYHSELLKVENLSVQFHGKRNFFGKSSSVVTAVNNVNFSLFRGETLGLVGESGCGKTTLSRALLRLIEPSGGRIIFNGI
ncbi:MAG TPA: ATP-binding cassette domain-containing protein, partial [Flavisolibacter sp.]|nr:ATP-binding cassette domain-containing protein [Flavisolibacter sp.]